MSAPFRRVQTRQNRAAEKHLGQLDTHYDLNCPACGKRAIHRVMLASGVYQYKHTKRVKTSGRDGGVTQTTYCEVQPSKQAS